MKKETTEEYTSQCTEIHNGYYDYSKVVYIGSKSKIIIICPIHGEFKQVASSHKSGVGCDLCARKKVNEEKLFSQDVFLGKCSKKHNNFYTYEKVRYTGTRNNITITCPVHGDFTQQAAVHLRGSGCPACKNFKLKTAKTKLNETFVKECAETHKGYYSYEKTKYVSAVASVIITCPIHGDFTQRAATHHKGSGCSLCGELRRKQSQTKPEEEFLEEADTTHKYRYDYSKVVYVKSAAKVIIGCPVHGDFKQLAGIHIKGAGCPICSAAARAKVQSTEAAAMFNGRGDILHRNKYDYSKVNYVGCKQKVIIICPEHGEFEQAPYAHLKGQGCPKCSHNISQGEQLLAEFIGEWYTIETQNRKILERKELDIYIPEKSLAIEYNGSYFHSEQFHDNPKKHMTDKTQMCLDKGIRLIHVADYEDPIIVKKTLAHILGVNQEKYYARSCELSKKSSNDLEIQEFLDQNHLQGHLKGCVAYTLRHNNSLVAVMLFSVANSERGNTDSTRWELRRFSSVCQVVGGASRLLTAFVREAKTCSTLISYSDNKWFTGKMYEKLGFNLVRALGPDYRYVKGGRIQAKGKFKRSRLKRREDIDFKEEETEVQNANRNGWYRLWDCGKKKWELKI